MLIKEVRNRQNLPESQHYIVASNHASHLDPFIIASIIFREKGKIVQYIGKKEALKNPIMKFIYHTFDVIPIDRHSKSKRPLNQAVERLKNKNIIGVFPEGTRTFDGKIQKGKTGIARIALYSKTYVVPIAIGGTFKLWPRHKRFPKIRKVVKVNIGKPMNFKNHKNKRISKKLLRNITNSIMKQINKLYLDAKQ